MMSAMSRSSSTTRISTRSVVLGRSRQNNHESGSARLTVLNADRVAMQLHQRLHDRQSKSAAGFAVPNGFSAPIEFVEDHLAFGFRHAWSIVGHRQLHVPIFGACRDLPQATTRRVLGGVAQEIRENLFDAAAIAENRWQ